MAREVGVYLITGFMDSGKTTLLKETLFNQEFGRGTKSVLVCCEDGDEEYDEDQLKTLPCTLIMVEDRERFSNGLLQEIEDTYRPDQVLIEYNGTWEIAHILEADFPKGWEIYQSIATVDASTYEMYYNNMRQMIKEQIFRADVVIFNRCDEETPKAKFRRTVKAINRAAQIVYERKDGTIDEGADEELPYDLNQEVIDLPDSDYGIWYLDSQDHPKNYEGKKIRFLALIYNPLSFRGKGMFVPGRFAMNCCAADTQFIGYKCKYKDADQIPHKSWAFVTAEVRIEWAKEYKGKGPVLYLTEITPTEPPEDELVYFT